MVEKNAIGPPPAPASGGDALLVVLGTGSKVRSFAFGHDAREALRCTVCIKRETAGPGSDALTQSAKTFPLWRGLGGGSLKM